MLVLSGFTGSLVAWIIHPFFLLEFFTIGVLSVIPSFGLELIRIACSCLILLCVVFFFLSRSIGVVTFH